MQNLHAKNIHITAFLVVLQNIKLKNNKENFKFFIKWQQISSELLDCATIHLVRR